MGRCRRAGAGGSTRTLSATAALAQETSGLGNYAARVRCSCAGLRSEKAHCVGVVVSRRRRRRRGCGVERASQIQNQSSEREMPSICVCVLRVWRRAASGEKRRKSAAGKCETTGRSDVLQLRSGEEAFEECPERRGQGARRNTTTCVQHKVIHAIPNAATTKRHDDHRLAAAATTTTAHQCRRRFVNSSNQPQKGWQQRQRRRPRRRMAPSYYFDNLTPITTTTVRQARSSRQKS